jgi:hypothetical protein
MTNNTIHPKLHFIFDFETMGQDIFHIPILDCSYMTFDWNRFTSGNPYSLLELVESAQYEKLNVKDQCTTYGAKFTKRDLDWWESHGDLAKRVLTPSEKDVSVITFIDNFIKYLHIEPRKIGHWWSRANTFDPLVLQRWATIAGKFDTITQYLEPWLIRDTRTFIDAKLNFPKVNGFVPISDQAYWDSTFVKHDSRFDIAADILRLQAICRAEDDLEMINR